MQFFNKTEQTPDSLQEAINNLYSELAGHDANTEEYDSITDQIVKLMELQNKLQTSKSWKPSPDAMIGAASSILGIVLILNYEKLGIVTTKAINFVRQTKS